MKRRDYQKEMESFIKGLDTFPTLLLHVCCAPCSSVALERLSDFFEITVFYYNPNIESKEEYDLRAAEAKRLTEEIRTKRPVKFVAGTYEPERYREAVKGLETAPEGGARCKECFRLRLFQAAKFARENGFSLFTTSLTTSPLKNAALLNEIGEEAAEAYGIKFLPSDFKKQEGYKRSTELSKEFNLYRQDYCGCLYSKRETKMRREQLSISKEERIAAIIDVHAFRENYRNLYRHLYPGMKAFLVIKANGYGHGAVPLMKAMEGEEGVYGAAVATFDEAIELRDAGIESPILILGPIPENRYEEVVERSILPMIFTKEQAEFLSKAAVRLGKTAPFHIKVDTGMSRIGLSPDETGLSIVKEIVSLPGIKAEGICTHLASMDAPDPSDAERQASRLKSFVELLKANGIEIEHVHIANSAASILRKGFDFADMARFGISLYGTTPCTEVDFSQVPVTPVMTFVSFVTYVKTVPKGTQVGYGGTYVTEKETKIATVGAGYADGYFRSLSNKGCVLIRKKRCPIIGRVCMDQFMVDVTDLPGVKPGDMVVLYGRDGEASLPIWEVAKTAGTIPHELFCAVAKRVKRFYVNEDL